MGRIMAFDYGRKRVGIAVTDVDQIIATGLDTVASHLIFEFLGTYLSQEEVVCFVVGEPRQWNNEPSEAQVFTEPFVKKLRKLYPGIPLERVDERFTSIMATRAIRDAGARRIDRQRKDLVDKVSATIILQHYLELVRNKS